MPESMETKFKRMAQETDEDYAYMLNETGMFRMLYPYLDDSVIGGVRLPSGFIPNA